MQAIRVGKGITTLRNRSNMSLQKLSDLVGIDMEYLIRLEEGCEPKVERCILEKIAQAVGVHKRGSSLTNDKLLDIFLYAGTSGPPKLL